MKRTTTEPQRIRSATAAGRFYPADPAKLRGMVEELLSQAPTAKGPTPKALIAPHAGYQFSGPIAASAYARLLPDRKSITRIVLLGPSHFVAVAGLAASRAEAFATPLGLVPVDTRAVSQLAALPQITLQDEAHAREHSIEVQLPLLQVVLSEFVVVPLAVGEATPEEVGQVLETLWGGPETRVIVSSDLSHYLDSDSAHRVDAETARAIEALDEDALGGNAACGRVSIRGLLRYARLCGLRAARLDLRNSGDTAGPRDHVVGYGAFAFEEKDAGGAPIDSEARR
jgi:AmmeMemoRadiSam system protein B